LDLDLSIVHLEFAMGLWFNDWGGGVWKRKFDIYNFDWRLMLEN
jgi:hypothetical protein